MIYLFVFGISFTLLYGLIQMLNHHDQYMHEPYLRREGLLFWQCFVIGCAAAWVVVFYLWRIS